MGNLCTSYLYAQCTINFKDEIRNSFINYKVSCLSDAQIIIIQNIVYSELCFLLEIGPGLILLTSACIFLSTYIVQVYMGMLHS